MVLIRWLGAIMAVFKKKRKEKRKKKIHFSHIIPSVEDSGQSGVCECCTAVC